MPKCRSAIQRSCAVDRSTVWRTPSKTTKSFPWPCILVNRKRMSDSNRNLGSIGISAAVGTAAETLVHPEILLGHFADPLLDEAVHPFGIGRQVVGRKNFPRRIKPRLVAPC